MSKMGMSRAEAKERVAGYSWDDMRRLLATTRPKLEGDAGRKPGRVNSSMSRAVAWNIYMRALNSPSLVATDAPMDSYMGGLLSRNILRDFGDSLRTRSVSKPPLPIYHEELDPVIDDG